MNNSLHFSKFVNVDSDTHLLTEFSTRYGESLKPNQYDFSGMRFFDGKNLVLHNYGKIGHFQVTSDVLEVYLFGNNMRITFDPYWEFSQIGYIGTREYGRETFMEKFNKMGFILTPLELVQLAKSKDVSEIVFKGGEPAVNADYISEVVALVKNDSLQITLETNGSISDEFLDDLENCKFKIWIFSTENEFYIKHTKRPLQSVLSFLDQLNSRSIDFEFMTLFIPEENNSEKQIEKLAYLMQQYHSEPVVNLYRFTPTFRILDKTINSIDDLETYTRQLQIAGIKEVVQTW